GGAEGDDRGAEQALADVAQPSRPAGPGVLLVEDHVPAQRQASAAVLDRPADAGPAVGAEVALPGQALVEQGVLVAGPTPAPHGGEVAGQALLEERSDLLAEGGVVGALPQVHAADDI